MLIARSGNENWFFEENNWGVNGGIILILLFI